MPDQSTRERKNAYMTAYRAANPDKIKASKQTPQYLAWRAAYNRAYHAKRRAKLLAQMRARRAVNRDELNARESVARAARHAAQFAALPRDIEWRPVVGFERTHEASVAGDIRRIAPGFGTRIGRVLKGAPDKDGYIRVTLPGSNDKKSCSRGRAPLVALTFVGPKPTPKHEVNHKNLNRADDRADNLEWVTTQENIAHAIAHGRRTRWSK